MMNYLFALLMSVLCAFAHADAGSTNAGIAALWYQAFDKKDPSFINRIIDENRVDIPSPAGTTPGPEALKRTFTMLTSISPDLGIKDVIEEGNKVVVRPEIS